MESLTKNNYQYDYLIVGAGLFGSVFAQQAIESGKRCLIIDKRSHTAGNAYTKNINGINVHMYGPHTVSYTHLTLPTNREV